MALVDYYLCDCCAQRGVDTKTFYDANLSYGEWEDDDMQHNPETDHPWPDGNVGFMIVICKDCAKTHEVKIVNRAAGAKGEE